MPSGFKPRCSASLAFITTAAEAPSENWLALPAAITPPESADTVHWGEAEFVAQEEMNRSKGAWWAPDDSRIAVERFDEAPVGIVTRSAIGAEGTKTFQQRYPVAGSPNALVSLHVIKPDGSGRVQVDLGADPDIYLARADWAPDDTSRDLATLASSGPASTGCGCASRDNCSR